MNRLRWQAILMGMVILAITGFQAYWLKDNYNREKKAVEVRTDALFHETVRNVQDSLLEEKWSNLLSADSSVAKELKTKFSTSPSKFPFLLVLQDSSASLIRKDPVIQQPISIRARAYIFL